MSSENLSLILILIGSFATIGLSVNAFFIKQLISSLAKVEMGLAVLISEHKNSDSKIRNNRKEIDKCNVEIKSIRDRLHIISNELNGFLLRLELKRESIDLMKDAGFNEKII